MNWPLVSRRAFDMVLDERDRLREQNDALLDNVTRIHRRELGMSEVPRAPRPELKPMPRALRDYIAGFASRSIQKTTRDEAYRRHAQGENWDSIEAAITTPKEPEDIGV